MEMTTKNASKPALGPVRLMKEEKEEAGWRRGEGEEEKEGGNPDSDEHVNKIYHLHFCSSMKAMGEKEKLDGGGGGGGNHQEEEEEGITTATTRRRRKTQQHHHHEATKKTSLIFVCP